MGVSTGISSKILASNQQYHSFVLAKTRMHGRAWQPAELSDASSATLPN
jgi:hypothetical protein